MKIEFDDSVAATGVIALVLATLIAAVAAHDMYRVYATVAHAECTTVE